MAENRKTNTFKDLEFNTTWLGIQALHQYPNGYGISVVQNCFSYGGREGLYELAIIRDGALCYTTPITGDVLGRLTPEDVTFYMGKVEQLPPESDEGGEICLTND